MLTMAVPKRVCGQLYRHACIDGTFPLSIGGASEGKMSPVSRPGTSEASGEYSMTKTITAVFDGQVLRPEASADLRTNQRYRLTLEPLEEEERPTDVWTVLEQLAGTIGAPPDWSAEHDHYLYGTPKRQRLP